MAHNHTHGHGHSHSHAPANFGRAFAIGITLNTLYVIVEAIIGLRIGSLGLLADAGHNASDVLSLIIAWVGSRLALRSANDRYTYGFKRSPIVASLFNALLLFGAMGIVLWEAIGRLQSPEPIEGTVIIWVTLIGLVVNFGTALLFVRGTNDLNIRGAYLHMLADGLVTLGVLLGGILIIVTNAYWIDPVISLIIVGVVLWGTWGLFRDAMRLSLDAVPNEIDLSAVKTYLSQLPNVLNVHDLHVWSMSTTETALTAHLVMKEMPLSTSQLIQQATEGLHDRFEIVHSTLQLEDEALAGNCGKC